MLTHERELPVPNDLEKYFYNNPGHLIHKWLHYFQIYDRHFSKFRQQPITLIEIGVFHGGSLEMWKNYFGPEARIIGVDLDPRCLTLGDEQVQVILGDQGDRNFLRSLRQEVGTADIVIDDGGHLMTQQIGTFDELWPMVNDGGVYLIEDLHTSYWPEYGGGYRNPDTFIEFAKVLIDQMNAWHAREQVPVTDYTRSLGGMHIYDSVIAFDKATIGPPSHRMTGVPSFELAEEHQNLLLSHSGESETTN